MVEQGCESHMSGLVEAKYVEVEGGFTIQVCGGPDSHCAGAEPPGIRLIVTHSQSHNRHTLTIVSHSKLTLLGSWLIAIVHSGTLSIMLLIHHSWTITGHPLANPGGSTCQAGPWDLGWELAS